MDIPENWEHRSGYHLNADGKAIQYEHTEKNLLAVIEAMVLEGESSPFDFQWYTVVFDKSNGKPWDLLEPHNFFPEKENAKQNLYFLLEKYN